MARQQEAMARRSAYTEFIWARRDIASCASAAFSGSEPPATPLAEEREVLVGLVWLVGLTNAFNLLDNMDGLAAGVVGGMTIDVERKGKVTAADLQGDSSIEILEPDAPIATLSDLQKTLVAGWIGRPVDLAYVRFGELFGMPRDASSVFARTQ